MTGKRNIAYDLATTGIDEGDAIIVIAPDTSAKSVYQKLSSRTASELTNENFSVIDCTGNAPSDTDTPGQHYSTESSADLTGVGIALSKQIEYLKKKDPNQSIRVLVTAISPLIMYTDIETAYRFLHVITSRLEAVDALGVFVFDSDAHDSETSGLITSLFDTKITTHNDREEQLAINGL